MNNILPSDYKVKKLNTLTCPKICSGELDQGLLLTKHKKVNTT